jgi:hypothetical protein
MRELNRISCIVERYQGGCTPDDARPRSDTGAFSILRSGTRSSADHWSLESKAPWQTICILMAATLEAALMTRLRL